MVCFMKATLGFEADMIREGIDPFLATPVHELTLIFSFITTGRSGNLGFRRSSKSSTGSQWISLPNLSPGR